MSNLSTPVQIAVLLTCFNRKDKTLRCLENLATQKLPENVCLSVVLVDDGSSDGTSDAVRENYPDVFVVESEGNLYWNQGMRLAWSTALKQQYDYFLLLNDDTELYSDAIARLLDVEKEIRDVNEKAGVVIGSTIDPVTGAHTYGGNNQLKTLFWKGFRFARVKPAEVPLRCDTFNANCVLISNEIVNDIGILSDRFTHGMGDFDYGLRAGEKGHFCWIVPGYIGTCSMNEITSTWVDPSMTLGQRKKLQKTPKGMPANEWLYFVKRHAGFMWTLAWLQLKLRLYFPGAWAILRKIRGIGK